MEKQDKLLTFRVNLVNKKHFLQWDVSLAHEQKVHELIQRRYYKNKDKLLNKINRHLNEFTRVAPIVVELLDVQQFEDVQEFDINARFISNNRVSWRRKLYTNIALILSIKETFNGIQVALGNESYHVATVVSSTYVYKK